MSPVRRYCCEQEFGRGVCGDLCIVCQVIRRKDYTHEQHTRRVSPFPSPARLCFFVCVSGFALLWVSVSSVDDPAAPFVLVYACVLVCGS